MRGFFRILSLFTAATVLSAAVISCVETEQNAYLRSLRHIGMTYINPVDSASLSDVEKFLALDIVKADDWLIMNSDGRSAFHLMFYNLKTSEHFLALRKGRGPGEIIQPACLQKHDGKILIYDIDKRFFFSVNVHETVSNKMAFLDTIASFGESFSKPSGIACCGKHEFITTNIISDDVWYSYSDWSGKILSSVPALEYRELSDDFDTRVSRLISSFLVSSPDGTKACVANIGFPAISFSSVKEGTLTEYRRYAYPAMGFRGTSITEDLVENFSSLQADEEYVYALYSGNKLRSGVLPAYESRHLIVYNWSGEPVRHFFLSRNITHFFVEGRRLYCDSSYPDFNVYVYDLGRYL